MAGFVVPCPLAPRVPHLLSRSCASPRACGGGFLPTPPRGDALALLLACGSANPWHEDLPRASSVPCPAHTPGMSRAVYHVGSMPWLDADAVGCLGLWLCCETRLDKVLIEGKGGTDAELLHHEEGDAIREGVIFIVMALEIRPSFIE
jgi:hypothetical protein